MTTLTDLQITWSVCFSDKIVAPTSQRKQVRWQGVFRRFRKQKMGVCVGRFPIFASGALQAKQKASSDSMDFTHRHKHTNKCPGLQIASPAASRILQNWTVFWFWWEWLKELELLSTSTSLCAAQLSAFAMQLCWLQTCWIQRSCSETCPPSSLMPRRFGRETTNFQTIQAGEQYVPV